MKGLGVRVSRRALGYESIVRSQLLPRFGGEPLETITPASIESWLVSLSGAPSTRIKSLVLMHGIFARARKVWGLQVNPVADVERPPLARSGGLEVFSPEEVWSLVRAAASEQDAALFLTAVFTGLRMGELLALRWREVDFAGSTIRRKAGKLQSSGGVGVFPQLSAKRGSCHGSGRRPRAAKQVSQGGRGLRSLLLRGAALPRSARTSANAGDATFGAVALSAHRRFSNTSL